MKDLNRFMDEIDSKKVEIAKVVSLAFSDGDIDKAKEYFPLFYKRMSETKTFIFKSNYDIGKSSYNRSIDSLLKDISDEIGFDVADYFYQGHVVVASSLLRDELDIPKKDLMEVKKMYDSHERSLIKLGITYNSCLRLYREKGIYGCMRLSKKVEELDKKTFMSNLKNGFSIMSDSIKMRILQEKAGRIVEKYGVKSLDDLMNLYTEVSSFYVDTSSLNEKERKIVEENKKNFILRVKDYSYLRNPKKLDDLRDELEKIYSNEAMRMIFQESNVSDFFDRVGVELNSENLRAVFNEYLYIHTVDGCRNITEYNKGNPVSKVLLNDSIFNESSSNQNEIVIHEYIHSLESFNPKIYASFIENARYVNEAMTQYFTVEAMKYLDSNILSDNDIEKKYTEYVNDYACMLPLIEVLKESEVWDDFIKAKLDNDYIFLTNKLGDNVNEVAELFKKVYFKDGRDIDRMATEEDIDQLKYMIDKMEKQKNHKRK